MVAMATIGLLSLYKGDGAIKMTSSDGFLGDLGMPCLWS